MLAGMDCGRIISWGTLSESCRRVVGDKGMRKRQWGEFSMFFFRLESKGRN